MSFLEELTLKVLLTYDELGEARDQPLTIVHRGVTIKIEKR